MIIDARKRLLLHIRIVNTMAEQYIRMWSCVYYDREQEVKSRTKTLAAAGFEPFCTAEKVNSDVRHILAANIQWTKDRRAAIIYTQHS